MSDGHDLVIGGGINGLAMAALLARRGRKVTVLERRAVLGGLATSEPLWPGYAVDTGWHDGALIPDQLVAELELHRHGLEFIESPAALSLYVDGDRPVTLWRDPATTRHELERLSPADAIAYPALRAELGRMRKVLGRALAQVPPELDGASLDDVTGWGGVLIEARRLGRRRLAELLRFAPMAVAQQLDERFTSDPLKAAIGGAGVTGLMQGPYAAGTALMLLYQGLPEERAGRYVRGGMGALVSALELAVGAAGGTIRLGAEVERIVVSASKARGVVLAGGEQIVADRVISTCDPKRTLLRWVGAPELELRAVRRLRNLRTRGTIARLYVALDGMPQFSGVGTQQARLGGRVVLCPSLEAMERAFDDAKYGRPSRQPYIELRLPTVIDATVAPIGQHLLVAQVQYAPHHLRDDTWANQRDTFAATILDQIAAVAPDLRDRMVAWELRTPEDIERIHGVTDGDVHHGQMALDQLLHMRPIAGFGRYRTTIDGLWLAGAGTHPGGGASGQATVNAVRLLEP